MENLSEFNKGWWNAFTTCLGEYKNRTDLYPYWADDVIKEAGITQEELAFVIAHDTEYIVYYERVIDYLTDMCKTL